VAAGTGFLFADPRGAVRELAQPEAGRTGVRMNDGACDPQGRFWAGTMAYDESAGAGAPIESSPPPRHGLDRASCTANPMPGAFSASTA
jgi:sugar lactone lactonase YvrE